MGLGTETEEEEKAVDIKGWMKRNIHFWKVSFSNKEKVKMLPSLEMFIENTRLISNTLKCCSFKKKHQSENFIINISSSNFYKIVLQTFQGPSY